MIGLLFRDIMSHQVCEVLLRPAEVQNAADEYHDRDHGRHAEAGVVHRDVAEDDRPVGVEEAGEGIEGEEPLQVPAEDACRIDHRRDEHQELDEEREDELDIPVLHADRREPVARPRREQDGQEDDRRQKDDRRWWHELVVNHHGGKDRRGDHVIHNPGKAGSRRDEYPRHVDLREERGVVDQAGSRER